LRVLLTGAAGQLGQALIASCPDGVKLRPLDRRRLDLSDAEACARAIEEFGPDWVINAGAYTAVDRAETEPELAMAVNAGAPEALAHALQQRGGRLLQLSTDFVFNGSQGHPYQPQQPVDPLGVYGASKAAGELAVQSSMDASRFCILRTSWVYGPVGHNFLRTMLRLLTERDEVGVVADQVGCPTATSGLAQACWAVLSQELIGVHHWSDFGVASWYDFAEAIAEIGVQIGLLKNPACIHPITTIAYPTPAKRPGYSLLDCVETRELLKLPGLHWRAALREVMSDVVE
jgi:dTDP-4-dehydrorhamnose reductase